MTLTLGAACGPGKANPKGLELSGELPIKEVWFEKNLKLKKKKKNRARPLESGCKDISSMFSTLSLSRFSRVPLFAAPWTVDHQAPLSMGFSKLCPWDSPGKNTGASCHFALQQISPNQGWNWWLLHQQVDSSPPSHLGSSFYFLWSVMYLVLSFASILVF